MSVALSSINRIFRVFLLEHSSYLLKMYFFLQIILGLEKIVHPTSPQRRLRFLKFQESKRVNLKDLKVYNQKSMKTGSPSVISSRPIRVMTPEWRMRPEDIDSNDFNEENSDDGQTASPRSSCTSEQMTVNVDKEQW